MHVAAVERGMFAPLNVAWLQLRHGYAKALEMGLLGQRHYGESLYEKGVVHKTPGYQYRMKMDSESLVFRY